MQTKTKRYLIFFSLFFILTTVSFFSCLSFAQISTNIINMSGKDWSFKVLNGGLEKSAFTVDTSKGKELRYIFNSFLETEKYNGIISFPIDMKGLTYYYQPPLDIELNLKDYDFINSTHAIIGKDVKIYRPIDVVNSYAVFNISGFKVMHIYRSQLIDFKGNAIYVDMKLDNNLLSVILDIDWLKNAVYPVIVDPTFQYTNIGTSNEVVDTWSVNTNATVYEGGTLTEIRVYTRETGKSLVAGIYLNDGEPYPKLAQSGPETSLANDWVIFSFNYPFSAGDYFLSFCANVSCGVKYDSVSSASIWDSHDQYPTLDNPMFVQMSLDRRYSVYATYTITGQNLIFDLSANININSGLGTTKNLNKGTEITTSFSSNGLTQKSMFKSGSEIILFTSNLLTQKTITGSLITEISDLFHIGDIKYTILPQISIGSITLLNDKLDLIIAISIICFCTVLVIIAYIPEYKKKK